MPGSNDNHLQEVAILTRAVENVFRKLIRFLVGRISLVKLQEMIRFIYVEEAEKAVRLKNPGKNVPLTRLALLTGLDTRTLVQVKKRIQEAGSHYEERYLKELTPESAIVEAWSARLDAAPLDSEHAILDYGSDDSEFEKLVRSTITSRGVTTKSIIERLLATNSIEQDKSRKKLKLTVKNFSPYLSDDEPNIFNAALSAIANMVSTVENNIQASEDDKLFQRQVWTFRLSSNDHLGFRKSLRKFLEDMEDKVRKKIEPWEKEIYGDEFITAGVGFYYFEEIGE